MISSQLFLDRVSNYFRFLIVEFGFHTDESKVREDIYYEQRFTDGRKLVSISYENIEDYLQVIVYLLKNGDLPAYDDRDRIIHVNQITSLVFPDLNQRELKLNNQGFEKFVAIDKTERELLKAAKDLRICLKHFPSFLLNK